jgi:DHA1 family purine ribonucleoside efflux pump-like MFS transporter
MSLAPTRSILRARDTPVVSLRDHLLLPLLLLCGIFGSATFMSVSAFLNEMSLDLGVSTGLMGQLSTASSLAAVVSALLLAPFISGWPVKRMLAGAVAAVGIFSMLSGVVAWFPALLVNQFLVGAGSATAATTALVITGRAWTEPAKRARRQGLLIGSFGVGTLLGTPVLRWIATWSGWQGALIAFGAFALLVATLTTLFMPSFPAERQTSADGTNRLRTALSAARLPTIGPTLLTSALMWSSWGMLGSFLAGFFADRHSGGDGWISVLWAADGLAFLLGSFGGGILIARAGNITRVLGWTLAGTALSLALFIWHPGGPFVTVALFAIWVALLATAANAMVALYQQRGGESAASILFLDSAIGKLGQVTGALLGGLAIEVGGGYGVCGGLVVLISLTAMTPLVGLRDSSVRWATASARRRRTAT